MQLECPLCEHPFEPSVVIRGEPVRCPVCDHAIAVTDPDGTETGSSTAASVRKSPPVKPETGSATNPISQSTASIPVLHLRRKRQLIRQIAGLSLLGLAAIGLCVAFVYLAQPSAERSVGEPRKTTVQEVPAGNEHDTATPESRNPPVFRNREILPPSSTPTTGDRGGNGKTKHRVGASNRSQPLPPWTQPRKQRFSGKALRESWLAVQPHLVKLTVDSPFGTRVVTGTLIDSRGWVLTSYRAVQQARSITVQGCPKSAPVSADGSADELVDQVRGYLATDPQHDLVILQVNRRFVISFRELEFAKQDRIVTSQRLIQCLVPTDAYPWPTTECRVRRQRTEDLEPALAERLRAAGLETDQMEWLAHDNPAPTLPGALLVDAEGTVQAMTLGIAPIPPRSGTSVAIPAHFIRELKASANGVVQSLPLPAAAEAGNAAARRAQPSDRWSGTPNAGALPDGLVALPTTSKHRSLSVALNRAGDACRQFGWWPGDATRSVALNDFVTQWTRARKIVENREGSDQELEMLQQQVDFWAGQLKQRVLDHQPLDDSAMQAFNEAVEHPGDGPGPFLIFAEIHLGAITSPEIKIEAQAPDETVTLRVVGRDHLLIGNTRPGWPILRPGTRWLVWGGQRRGTFLIVDSDETDDAKRPPHSAERCHASLFFSFDAVPQPEQPEN